LEVYFGVDVVGAFEGSDGQSQIIRVQIRDLEGNVDRFGDHPLRGSGFVLLPGSGGLRGFQFLGGSRGIVGVALPEFRGHLLLRVGEGLVRGFVLFRPRRARGSAASIADRHLVLGHVDVPELVRVTFCQVQASFHVMRA